MHVLILGGGGFLGHRLATRLIHEGGLAAGDITRLTLLDVGFPPARLSDSRVRYVQGDFSDEATIRDVLQQKPSVIFHLAAIVSGEAEKNLDLGMKVNFHASYQLLELCRHMGFRPRIVFTSSCGVFGGDVTQIITDETAPKPRSSYGTEKAMVELLLNDYSRRKFVDARSLRLPTIAIRPGKPNAATSSFISSIVREPLNGQKATYPVPASSEFWILSPRRVVEHFIHAANIDEASLGDDRTINLPGITVSVETMIGSLERIAGPATTALISYQPDDFLRSIVLTWPPHFGTSRAHSLGFKGDQSVDEIIRSYIEEENITLNKT